MSRIKKIMTSESEQPKPKNKYRGRKIKAIICFLMVAVIAFGAIPLVYKQQSNTEKIVVAASDIPMGTIIKKSDVKLSERGTYGQDKVLLYYDVEDVVGQKAVIDIVEDDNIYSSKIGKDSINPLLNEYAKAGKGLVTVTVKTNAAGLASNIEAGDILKIYSVRQGVDEYGNTIDAVVTQPAELSAMEVYEVENINTDRVSEKKNSDNAEDYIAATITFIGTDAQIAKLIECEYIGEIHTAFVKRGGGK